MLSRAAGLLGLPATPRRTDLSQVCTCIERESGRGHQLRMEGKPVAQDVPRIVFRFCRDAFWLGLTAYAFYKLAWALDAL